MEQHLHYTINKKSILQNFHLYYSFIYNAFLYLFYVYIKLIMIYEKLAMSKHETL